MAILLGLISAVSWGGGDFLGGLMTRRLPTLRVILWGQMVGGGALCVIVIVVRQPVTLADILWGMLGGVGGLVGLFLLYRGMAKGTIAIVSPLSASGAIVPLALALLSGAVPTPIALVGVALAAGGAVLTSLAPSHQPTNGRSVHSATISVLYGLGAALGFGAFFVFLARGAATGTAALWVIVGARAATVPLLIAIGWRTRALTPPTCRWLPGVAGSGLLDTFANVVYASATTLGNLGIVSVLAALYPVTTVALAFVVLRERLTPLQSAGIALALIGIACMSL